MHEQLFDFISRYIEINEEERNEILSLDIFRSYKKGTVLLKMGQTSPYEYFVLKGCIRKYYVLDGEVKTTQFFTEMEGLTPHCATLNTPSEYYISCVEDCILTVAHINMGTDLFEKFPKFQLMCKVLSEENLAKQQLNLDEFKTCSPEQRYLNLLKNRPDLIQRVPQQQLASFLGILPQSLSRLRARIMEKSKC